MRFSIRRCLPTSSRIGPLVPSLKSRGLISQITSADFERLPEQKQLGVYLGADPTADSLHLGNLMPFMVLMHFYLRGHKVLPLIGGATGIVGDPSGRTSERASMESQQREQNIAKISAQMEAILKNCRSVASKYYEGLVEPDTASSNVTPVNNRSWWENVNMLWFLGTFGKHIRVGSMLGRESVRQRLKTEAGMGYNEFSYQVLQAYDFYYLYSNYNCQCQIGGHDQWGNITAGVELINRLHKSAGTDKEPVGITVPLLTTPSGEKFGKSAGNAVFLSSERTKPYHLFQYLIKSPDTVVETYLKLFTFIPETQIESIMGEHARVPEKRIAQRRLAAEVTELVHGAEQAELASVVSSVMFGESDSSSEDILRAFKSQGLAHQYPREQLLKTSYKDLLSKLSGRSKSEIQRLIKNGSVYVGVNRAVLHSLNIEPEHLSEGNVLLLRMGKTDYYVVEVLP